MVGFDSIGVAVFFRVVMCTPSAASLLGFCTPYVRYWRKADIPPARYQVQFAELPTTRQHRFGPFAAGG